MKRLLPYPAMSAFILGAWLLLNQSVAPGHLILGAILAVALSALMRPLDLPPVRVRNHRLILVLAARVAWDVLRSNIAVFRIILSGGHRKITSGFVQVPLELSNGYGLAVLACIITSTPGTIWMSYDDKERVLLIHVFDLVDEAIWISTVTERYERPLREIFE
ncbi:MAG: Na+/H+ antiporter subunit E [Phenylobacterium sp.]|uniref:Na+/H+ antiporter subunit E n=1 Tax=Phenylobacterium sp. TaxID=1871053 RepID=UPI0027350525|nr:Na+/H+ antiporter subunit E [Phenylobacterium sp.]MDP3173325.1 Na+/H+ antiporter subunit E [Phenylobacterium sp.]